MLLGCGVMVCNVMMGCNRMKSRRKAHLKFDEHDNTITPIKARRLQSSLCYRYQIQAGDSNATERH